MGSVGKSRRGHSSNSNGGRIGGRWRAAALFWVCLFATVYGCAGVRHANGIRDPIEGVNRAIYKFNDALDRAVLKPVAETYMEITPELAQTGISNFFDNLTYVNVIVNDFLQGKAVQGLADTGRLLLNTTLGFAGLIDVATPRGLVKHAEDLGQTLGVWGFGEGFYLVLPLLGPTTVRDAPGLAVGSGTNPLFYVGNLAITIPGGAVGVVDNRARLNDAIRLRDEAAIDSYIFTREAYLQRRSYLISDGNPPEPEYFDEFEDEEEE